MACSPYQTPWPPSVRSWPRSCATRPLNLLHFCQGIVPSLLLTIFLGVFALYTAKLLIDFKLNHPEVHNMGQYFLPSDQEFQNLSLGPRSEIHAAAAVVIAPAPDVAFCLYFAPCGRVHGEGRFPYSTACTLERLWRGGGRLEPPQRLWTPPCLRPISEPWPPFPSFKIENCGVIRER